MFDDHGIESLVFELPTPTRTLADRLRARRRLVISMLLLPCIVAIGASIGWLSSRPLSRLHPRVALAEKIYLQSQATSPVDDDQYLMPERCRVSAPCRPNWRGFLAILSVKTFMRSLLASVCFSSSVTR